MTSGVYSLSPEEMLRLRGGSPAFTAGLNQSMQQPQMQAPQMQQMPQAPPAPMPSPQPQQAAPMPSPQAPQAPQRQPFDMRALMQYGGQDGNYKLKMKDGMVKSSRGFGGIAGQFGDQFGGGFGTGAPGHGKGRSGGK